MGKGDGPRRLTEGTTGIAARRSGGHQEIQEKERETAQNLWQEGGWVFTDHFGQPLNTDTDHREWKVLLEEAGPRDSRLHDARHTAATVPLVLRVPDRAVMALVGWSPASMTKRHQHVVAKVRTDVVDRVGGLIWESSQEGESGPETAN